MGLGNRNANARHGSPETSASAYWLFKPGQRVMTVDGFAGHIARVEDGPHAGNEHYIVELDNGMGGGTYQPGQLTALRQETADHHTAADDYPELSHILVERPDIAPNTVTAAKHASASCPSCGTWTEMHNPNEECPACGHQLAHESEGLLTPDHLRADPQRVGFPHRGAHDHDHYMGTEECPEGDEPGFEHGHLTWGGQAAQGEGDDYSVLGVPRVAAKHSSYRDLGPSCNCGLECPECGELNEGEGFANGEGHECASCGSNVWHGAECENCDSHEHGTSECPHPSYDRISPDADFQGRDYSAEDPFAARRAMLESRLGGEFNGLQECDHCGSASHATGEHDSAADREDEDRDYGHDCEYCGSEDHTTDDHEDEPQDDDAFIHGDGSASMGHHHLSRPPYGHPNPHEWAHHAIEQEMQTSGYYPNIWDENGNHCHQHHQEAVANELKREHPMVGMKPPCPFCNSHNQSDASGHNQEPFDESKHGLQTEHLSRCHDCKAVYDPCEAGDTGHMTGEDAPLEGKDPEEHAERAVNDAFSDTHPAAYDLLNSNTTGPSRYSSLSVYSILVDAAADPEFRFEITAAWKDVRNKAKRLRTTGQVTITAASDGAITGVVKGDHFTYETQIQRLPGHHGVAVWQCGCKWAAYAWGRSPRYKHLEGRMCSHALALHYEAQSRGMFGREIYEDSTRPKWLRADSPIVIEFDKSQDRNLTRRAIPPGNMRSTWGSLDAPTPSKRETMDRVTADAENNNHQNLAWVHTGQGYSHLDCDDCGLRSTIVDSPGHGWGSTTHHPLTLPCVDRDDHAYHALCPACGDAADYCQGHGESGDPVGHSILRNHDDGVHDDCVEGACDERDSYHGGEGTQAPNEHGHDYDTAWQGPDYDHEDPFSPRRIKPEDADRTVNHIDRAINGEAVLKTAIREALAQGEDPAGIALVMHTAGIQRVGLWFQADQQYEDDSMASDGGAGGDNGEEGFSPTLDAGDPTTGQPAPLSVQDYDETSAGYKDGSSSYNGGGIGSTGMVTDPGSIPQGAAVPGSATSMDSRQFEDESPDQATDEESQSYSNDKTRRATLNMDPEPALPSTDGGDNDLEQNPVVNSLAPNGGEDDRTAARRAFNDPTMDCCGRDAADCDCEETHVHGDDVDDSGRDYSQHDPFSPRTSFRRTAGHAQVHVMGGAPPEYPHAFMPVCHHPDHHEDPQYKHDYDGEPMPGFWSGQVYRGNDNQSEGWHQAWSEAEQHDREHHTSPDSMGAPNYDEEDPFSPRKESAAVQLHQDEEPTEDESAPELTDNAVAASLKTAGCDLCDSTKHDTFGHYTATEGGDPEGREEERIAEENAALSGMQQDDYDTKYSSLRPNENPDPLWAIVDQFQRSASHLDPGPGGNSGENDIAAAAREYLQKSALKDFTPGEQAALINEGEGVTAANLDRLQIEGTHYEALEAALAAEDDPVGLFD